MFSVSSVASLDPTSILASPSRPRMKWSERVVSWRRSRLSVSHQGSHRRALPGRTRSHPLATIGAPLNTGPATTLPCGRPHLGQDNAAWPQTRGTLFH
jgi:hypothetical protein